MTKYNIRIETQRVTRQRKNRTTKIIISIMVYCRLTITVDVAAAMTNFNTYLFLYYFYRKSMQRDLQCKMFMHKLM